jgi:hypothetical protein
LRVILQTRWSSLIKKDKEQVRQASQELPEVEAARLIADIRKIITGDE